MRPLAFSGGAGGGAGDWAASRRGGAAGAGARCITGRFAAGLGLRRAALGFRARTTRGAGLGVGFGFGVPLRDGAFGGLDEACAGFRTTDAELAGGAAGSAGGEDASAGALSGSGVEGVAGAAGTGAGAAGVRETRNCDASPPGLTSCT
jgi:hypothetical protein